MLNFQGWFERVAFGLLSSMFSFALRPTFPICTLTFESWADNGRNLRCGDFLHHLVLLFR
jgi:hypothetical protein